MRKGRLQRIQVKGHVILPNAKPGQRIGRIDPAKQWDTVLLLILDENYDATEVIEVPVALEPTGD